MKIAIMGTGGVGGYYGGLLAKAGEDVTFIARGEHLRAIRERGLQVKSIHGDFTISPARATDDPAEVGPVELVLFCVKTYHTDEAGPAIVPMVGEDTTVLSLQNGIDNQEKLARFVEEKAVLGGATWIESAISEPGVIRQGSQFRRIAFGELDGSVTPRAERILETLQKTGADVTLSTEIMKVLWTKFLFICGISGITSVTRSPVADVLNCPETRELFIEAMREIENLARVKGIQLDEDAVEKSLALIEGAPPTLKSSMQRDLERGSRLELEALNGTVVRLGQELGVPTPVNRCIYACLKLHDDKARVASG
ncbi:MAG: 2-dehydropantoate 2-reductase [Anaerolineae bacterium]